MIFIAASPICSATMFVSKTASTDESGNCTEREVRVSVLLLLFYFNFTKFVSKMMMNYFVVVVVLYIYTCVCVWGGGGGLSVCLDCFFLLLLRPYLWSGREGGAGGEGGGWG